MKNGARKQALSRKIKIKKWADLAVVVGSIFKDGYECILENGKLFHC